MIRTTLIAANATSVSCPPLAVPSPSVIRKATTLGSPDGLSDVFEYPMCRMSVVVSAAGDAQERATEMGALGFLRKPLDLKDLLATVERYC